LSFSHHSNGGVRWGRWPDWIEWSSPRVLCRGLNLMVWRPHCGPRLVRRSVATSGEAQDRIKAPPPCARAPARQLPAHSVPFDIIAAFVRRYRVRLCQESCSYALLGQYCLHALVSPTHAVFLSREKRSIGRSSESHIRRVQYAAQDAGRSAPKLQRPRWRVRGRRSVSQSRPGRAGRSLGHGTEMRRAPCA